MPSLPQPPLPARRFDMMAPPVSVEGDSIRFAPSRMVLNHYYCVELNGKPYLYRRVSDHEIEVYGLSDILEGILKLRIHNRVAEMSDDVTISDQQIAYRVLEMTTLDLWRLSKTLGVNELEDKTKSRIELARAILERTHRLGRGEELRRSVLEWLRGHPRG